MTKLTPRQLQYFCLSSRAFTIGRIRGTQTYKYYKSPNSFVITCLFNEPNTATVCRSNKIYFSYLLHRLRSGAHTYKEDGQFRLKLYDSGYTEVDKKIKPSRL